MIKNLYVVRDRLTRFQEIFAQDNDAVAMRSFENWCLLECKENPRMANDFSLMCIGTYDDDKGIIKGNEPNVPQLIMVGAEVMDKFDLEV